MEGSSEDRRRYWGNAVTFQLARLGYYELEPAFTTLAMRGAIDPFTEIMRRAQAGEINLPPSRLQKVLNDNLARDTADDRTQILSDLQTSTNSLGVLSLSGVRDEILLWSHYADCHQGLCLEFHVEAGSTPFGSSLLTSAQPVDYLEDYPEVGLYETDELVWTRAILMTKAEQWQYENEYRCIDPKGGGLRSFPEDQLAAVLLGCQMSDADRTEVLSWVEQRKRPLVVYQAHMADRKYAIVFTQLR